MLAITDQQTYLQAMSEIDMLFAKGQDNLTLSEGERLDELSKAVEEWEEKVYPMPLGLPPKTIQEML